MNTAYTKHSDTTVNAIKLVLEAIYAASALLELADDNPDSVETGIVHVLEDARVELYEAIFERAKGEDGNQIPSSDDGARILVKAYGNSSDARFIKLAEDDGYLDEISQ
jgi:hypothetical protein